MATQQPAPVPLDAGTEQRIALLFEPSEHDAVRRLLREQCGRNLPISEHADAHSFQRLHFAALRLSGGRWSELVRAVELAKIDWRDLLMAAGFGLKVDAHLQWWPDKPPAR